MNKKCLSIFIATFLLLNMVSGVSFAAKKDVADPVLQEIISELSSKMPRFINKYGAAIFVADEQITRGTLLQALYEYDKKASSGASSSSVSSAGVISKKDYDALNAKVIALEKKVKSGAGTTAVASSKSSKSAELVDIMEDLEVNMPMLLDNTLENSKVFKALEKKVNAASSGNVAVASSMDADVSLPSGSQKSLATLQRNIISLNKKVDAVELSLASIQNGTTSVASSSKQSKSSVDALYELKNLQKEIDSMNEKVSLMEAKLDKSKGVSSVYNGPSEEDFNSLKKAVIQVNRSYVALGKRVDGLEKEQQMYSASSSSSATPASLNAKQMQLINARINSIKQSVDDIKAEGMSSYSGGTQSTADIKRIEKRLSNLEKSKTSYSSSSSDESSSSSKSGTIAKVSLGLSLIAALFIAR